MPKVAQLPDGSELHFDDNLADHAVDAAVRSHMGVPPDPDAGAMQMQQLAQMIGQFGRLAVTLHNGITALTQTQQALMEKIDHLGMAIVQSAQKPDTGESAEAKAIGELSAAVGSAVSRITAALAAPKRLTFDKNGKPTGVTTEGED